MVTSTNKDERNNTITAEQLVSNSLKRLENSISAIKVDPIWQKQCINLINADFLVYAREILGEAIQLKKVFNQEQQDISYDEKMNALSLVLTSLNTVIEKIHDYCYQASATNNFNPAEACTTIKNELLQLKANGDYLQQQARQPLVARILGLLNVFVGATLIAFGIGSGNPLMFGMGLFNTVLGVKLNVGGGKHEADIKQLNEQINYLTGGVNRLFTPATNIAGMKLVEETRKPSLATTPSYF